MNDKYWNSYIRRGQEIIYSQPNTNNSHDYQDTTFYASGKRAGFLGSVKGRYGSWMNMVTETKSEFVVDGDGRPVIENQGTRFFHINNPPSGSLTASPYMYQVWSTVLGASLTSITPQGNKLTTNIYAGGTVIAKQKRFVDGSTNYDSIDWSTADPVTGTVGIYSYSSEGSATDVENFEPLGQKIHPHDPEDYEPPNNHPVPNSADYPEWQCEVAKWKDGNFLTWPDHCAMRALRDPDFQGPWTDPWGGGLKPWFNLSFTFSFAPTPTSKVSRRPIHYEESPINFIHEDYKDASWYPDEPCPDPPCRPKKNPPVVNPRPKGPQAIGAEGKAANDDGIDCDKKPLQEVEVTDGSSNRNDRNKKNIPYINSSIFPQFQAALNEINSKIGYIGFSEMFRDRARQQYLWDEKKAGRNPNKVAPPGTSNHESGYAFDVPDLYRLMKSSSGESVESVFIKHGFLKTVVADEPHFAWKGRPTGATNVKLNAQINAWFLKCTNGY